MKTSQSFLLAGLGFALCPFVFAVDNPTPAADATARLAQMRRTAAQIKYVQGDVVLRGGVAKVSVPANFRYINPSDTALVLTKIWENPHGDGTLGMLVPVGFNPLKSGQWGAVITYQEDGYVKDNDAAKIDYDKLLADMKSGTAAASKEREKQGYDRIELAGWAAQPRYDASTHKLYWAKDIIFGTEGEHTLNYDIRMLGRRGVLVINVVAPIADLHKVEAAAPSIISMVNFQDGHRYADFTPSTDKVATYGVAALIAGGLAAKAGLFKGLLVAIIALKKFVIIGVLAIIGFVKKLFGRKSSV